MFWWIPLGRSKVLQYFASLENTFRKKALWSKRQKNRVGTWQPPWWNLSQKMKNARNIGRCPLKRRLSVDPLINGSAILQFHQRTTFNGYSFIFFPSGQLSTFKVRHLPINGQLSTLSVFYGWSTDNFNGR